ncbi:hypothetical protein [Akkermansia massiliensis]|uniref:hypothetical protein n=1 Tax=Akkermansia massiliensis TaxID=2927224 RepID=UPI00202F3F15|nr:hypothetical protein [Akkermansia sp. B2-R-115]MCM0684594.1 hypothetical protein [Akkermansia sp. B2-R-115]
MLEKNGPSLLPAGLRPPEQPQLFHTPLNDTKSSFTGPTVRTYGAPPTPSPLEKEDPPSFIPSKTPPFHGTGKSGVFVVETDN